jgi:threonine/homoserine/homoserine lactone efflux protein
MSLLSEISNPCLEAFTGGLSYGLIFYTSEFLTCVTPIDSFALAVLLDLDTVSSLILLSGVNRGCLLNKAPLFREWISKIDAGTFIVLGLDILRNTIMITYS